MAAFGNVALLDVLAGDNRYGGMVTAGGELVMTLHGTVHGGVGVEAGRIARTKRGTEVRQTAVTLSVIREWPTAARVRGLAGAGVGVLFQRLRGVYSSGVPWSASHSPVALYARGGVVGTVTRHLCIRAEATYSNTGYWLGTFGVRVGIGYVF